MPKPYNQKMKLFYVLEMFQAETDENHGLTIDRIKNNLEKKGIKSERKSIKDDMYALTTHGLEIKQIPHKRPKQYFLATRDFTLAEVKYLMDSVQSSKFLSTKTTKELNDKLKTLLSKHERVALDRQVIVSNRVKSTNDFIQNNIDIITQAIAANQQIKFRYAYYDENKKKRFRKKADTEGFYFVSPYALIYTDDNYYLLGYEGKMKHFRVDKMEKMEKALLPREGQEEYKQIDMRAYTNYTFSMYSGKMTNVTMVFANHMMDAVLDRFGHDVVASRYDDRHFKIIVPVAVSNQFFAWVFGLGKAARIIDPPEVKAQMKILLDDISSRYVNE